MNKIDEYVITGAGVVSPIGVGKQQFWEALLANKSNFTPQSIFQNGQHAPLMGKVSLSPEQLTFLNPRIQRKIDRFTLLAFIAMQEALHHSALAESHAAGMILGNTFGGWSFVEPQMHDLYYVAYETLNPYVATAWFPTAPQGEISIFFGLQGYSKTISADYLSVGYGLMHAIDILQEGTLDTCFIGGVEAPLTALVYNSCQELGILSKQRTLPLPFHDNADGYFLSEGAGIMAIEKEAYAQSRRAPALAKIGSIGNGNTYEEAISNCLDRADVSPSEVGGILLDAKGFPTQDANEYQAIHHIFSKTEQIPLIGAPKTFYGNVFSADIAIQMITALLIIENNRFPATPVEASRFISPFYGSYVTTSVPYFSNNILINASDLHGHCISILIKRP